MTYVFVISLITNESTTCKLANNHFQNRTFRKHACRVGNRKPSTFKTALNDVHSDVVSDDDVGELLYLKFTKIFKFFDKFIFSNYS